MQHILCVERKLLSINHLTKFRVMETATLKIAKSLALCDLRTTQNVYWTYTTDEKRNIDRKDEQRLPSYFLRITKCYRVMSNIIAPTIL